MRAFIPKDDPELPDSYKLKLHYINGKTLDLDVVSHVIVNKVIVPSPEGKLSDENGNLFDYEINPMPFYEIKTKDDTILIVSMMNASIELGRGYSDLMELIEKIKTEKSKKIK